MASSSTAATDAAVVAEETIVVEVIKALPTDTLLSSTTIEVDEKPHGVISRTEDYEDGLTLEWCNVSYSIPIKKKAPEKQLLKGMDGIARPGEVIAIMGGSGAGKSTLLNVLAGRIGAGTLEGEITVNGRPRVRSSWRKATGYVEQEEVMYKNLTVTETLMYSAQLRLPSALTQQEKKSRVEEVIAELSLNNCRDTIIGDSDVRGISGGEKKRVSIGIELVTQPKLLFLDEPTSGLDAFTAVNIISTISSVAKNPARKTTVVMTIHQPRTDILKQVDRIMLLAAGRAVFFGKLDDALSFFAGLEYPLPPATNPSDHFLDVSTLDLRSRELEEKSRARIELFASTWEKTKEKALSDGGETNAATLTPKDGAAGMDDERDSRIARYNSTWATQFGILLRRNLQNELRDYGTLGATLGQGVIICLLLGFIFFRLDLSTAGIQNRIGGLFFLITNQTFGTVMPTLAVLPLQRLIIKRERAAGTYRASAAYLAKLVATIPLTVAGSLLLSLPVYWMMGLQNSGSKYLIFIGVVMLHSVTAMSMGLMIGSGIKNVRVGQIIGPLIIVLFLIFGGQLANLSSLPVVFRWIQYVSIVSYSNKALNQNEFAGLVFTNYDNTITTGETVISNFSFGDPSLGLCVLANCCIAVGFVCVGYFLFLRTSKPQLRLK